MHPHEHFKTNHKVQTTWKFWCCISKRSSACHLKNISQAANAGHTSASLTCFSMPTMIYFNAPIRYCNRSTCSLSKITKLLFKSQHIKELSRRLKRKFVSFKHECHLLVSKLNHVHGMSSSPGMSKYEYFEVRCLSICADVWGWSLQALCTTSFLSMVDLHSGRYVTQVNKNRQDSSLKGIQRQS